MSKCISWLDNVYQFVEILQLIAEPNRIKILCLLADAAHAPEHYQKDKENYQGLCVSEIMKSIDKPQALISHHLSMLKRVDLVKTQKQGTKVLYQLNAEVFNCIKENLKTVFHLK